MRTLKIRIFGIVQGVGFRPFTHRLAQKCHIQGNVVNKGSLVEITAQGEPEHLALFQSKLLQDTPRRAIIMQTSTEEIDAPPLQDFTIAESVHDEAVDKLLSPDIGICQECAKEMFDPHNRRYLHPFINCTDCGPRLTIIDAMPYDRERTSMAHFALCPVCEREYTTPADRRYDAQAVCCPQCGPHIFVQDKSVYDQEAISLARKVIMSGGIVAVKGIGGFHLCCDAYSEEAVQRLRQKKRRPAKPFAVMFKDLASVQQECKVDAEQEKWLLAWQKPIVLLERAKTSRLCASLAPDNPRIGVLLPYTPLHLLLFALPDGLEISPALVMTSANASGAPICYKNEDVEREIGSFCDLVLMHDRAIRIRADDSVLDLVEGRPSMLRRSRGFAPLPQILSGQWTGSVLGIGGELKNTFCLGKNGLFYLSPHIGDLGDVRAVQALEDALKRMQNLLAIQPEIVACDLHPAYFSSALARQMNLPVLEVQHHYAHILSCLAENDCSQRVIGVAFDGTGYGTDGTIWGGEFFLADFSGFVRKASLTPFVQSGGDQAVKQGWRIALSICKELYGKSMFDFSQQLALCTKEEAEMHWLMSERKINSVQSTSAGRIFDAVSAILGLKRQSSFEGEAAMCLQFAAEKYVQSHPEAMTQVLREPVLFAPQTRDDMLDLPVHKLLDKIVQDYLAGQDKNYLAWLFHAELAKMLTATCLHLRVASDLNICALSGGVFQNKLFTTLCCKSLRTHNFQVLTHKLVPANDGGLALGQAVAAMQTLKHS